MQSSLALFSFMLTAFGRWPFSSDCSPVFTSSSRLFPTDPVVTDGDEVFAIRLRRELELARICVQKRFADCSLITSPTSAATLCMQRSPAV